MGLVYERVERRETDWQIRAASAVMQILHQSNVGFIEQRPPAATGTVSVNVK